MLSKKVFFILLGTIILIALLERIIPSLGNNFYFTVDQGNDAVYVREILERDQVFLKGPETDISGLHAGPLWYYFIAIGYKLFNGNPFGALFMLIVLNVVTIGVIVLIVAKHVSRLWGVLIGVSLLLFWPFFDASRYAFNPFVLIPISFATIILLVNFLSGNKRSFLLAAIPIGLGFHAEIAGSAALLLFYIAIGIWALFKKRISLTTLMAGGSIIAIFFIPHAISELKSGFAQTYSLLREFKVSEGAFSSHSIPGISGYVFAQITKSVFYQNQIIGLALFLLASYLFWTKLKGKEKVNALVTRFSLFTAVLTLVTFLFFSSNSGWRDWQTVYLQPLIFVSLLLLLSQIKWKISFILLAIIISSQGITFTQRYSELFSKSEDQSILANQLATIDWIYEQSNGKGFNVYSYVPPAIDYPYQYLFWWRGLAKYKYVPCDYSSYPGAPKPFYIPGSMYYEDPKKECTNLRFLIIEPSKDHQTREQWIKGTSENTQFIEEKGIGKINIEKRLLVQ